MSELYELPNGWEWIEFSKVFDNPTSKPYQIQKSEYLDDGLLPIIDQGKEFIIGYTNSIEKKYSNKSNCIIFGDHTRQIKYVDFDFVIGADGTKILKENDSNKFDLKFLYYQFTSKKIDSLGYSRHFKLVKEMFFAIPPLTEQQRIVSKLDKLFEKIDKSIALHQKNMDEADVFMGSVLNDVFGELEEKYPNTKVEDLCTKITDGTHSTPKYIESGVPFLSVKNISQGIINFDDTKYVSEEEHFILSKRCNVEKNDILYTKVGTTGIAKVVDTDIEFSIFVSIALLKPKKDLIESMYFQHILNSPNCYQQSQSRTRGMANRNLVLKDIKEINFPLPPLHIQQKVVKYLDEVSEKIEKVKSVQKVKMDSLKAFKASILDRAFRGEL